MDASEVTTETTLAEYVDAAGEADEAHADECEAAATALVDEKIGKRAGVPDEVRRLAILSCGSNLFESRRNQTGTMNFEGDFQPAVRVTRDPMARATALLRPYLGPGIA